MRDLFRKQNTEFLLGNKTDAELEYIKDDCCKAISAHPQNINTEYYLALVRACEKDLSFRATKRIFRSILKTGLHDDLRVSMRKMTRCQRQRIRGRNADKWVRFCFWNANLQLAKLKEE